MKKQTYWKAIRNKDKSIGFKEAQGYVIDLTDNKGYTVKVALEYKRPYWQATHYESGLSCTPRRKVKGSAYPTDHYKSKEELIEELKTIDFSRANSRLDIAKHQLADFIKKNYEGVSL